MSVHRHPRHAPDERELIAYADGRIDSNSANGREIAAWLETQPAALRRVREYMQQDRDIRAHYASRLAAPLPPHLRPASMRRRLRRNLRTAVAATAAVIIAAVATWLLQERLHANGLDRFAQDVALQLGRDHTDAQMPVAEMRPAFMPEHFAVTGIRQLQASSGALTEYRYRDAGGRNLYLFVSGEPQASDDTLHWRHDDGRSIVYWQHQGRRYALTGELHVPELQQLAHQALQQRPAIDVMPASAAAAIAVAEPPVALPEGRVAGDAAPLIGVDTLESLGAAQPLEQPLL